MELETCREGQRISMNFIEFPQNPWEEKETTSIKTVVSFRNVSYVTPSCLSEFLGSSAT